MKKSQDLVKSSNDEAVRLCFEVFDQDCNGLITESEFVVHYFLQIRICLSILCNQLSNVKTYFKQELTRIILPI